MEGKKFSSSKKVVIYVRDLLSRYQPDAFRYFVAAAGPENQDSDFTWAEFVRRTNDELVAGWGNLVNRTATLIHKNFGEIPAGGELTAEDRAVLDATEAAFDTVGDLIGRNRMRQAIGEAMRAVGDVNKYVSDHEPWKLKGADERDRLATILYVAAQCVADLNLVLSPFLPFSANEVDRVLGGRAPWPRCRSSRRRRISTAARRTRSSRGTTPAPRLAAAPDRARHAGRQADADLHQARPVHRRRGARAPRGHAMSLAFLVTALVIVATPGTGALYTIAAGLARGTRASVLAAFACTLGTLPHLLAAVTGLAAVLHASGVAFQAIKYLGVAYLLWMAWSTWRDTGALTVDTDGGLTCAAR